MKGVSMQELLKQRVISLSDIFQGWGADNIQQLSAASRMETLQRKTNPLLHGKESSDLMLVVSGFIEMARIGVDGKKFTHGFIGSGAVARLPLLFEKDPVPYSYLVHVETTIIYVPSAVALGILEKDPGLWKGVAEVLFRRQMRRLQKIERNALLSLGEKLLDIFDLLSRVQGGSGSRGGIVEINVSQETLAEMMGMSRQTVNKELTLLERKGLIKRGRNRIELIVEKWQSARSRCGMSDSPSLVGPYT